MESAEAYEYWVVALENSNLSKRVYARASKESELFEEALNTNKNQKLTIEESDTVESADAEEDESVEEGVVVEVNMAVGLDINDEPRSLANIFSAWSSFIDLFLAGTLMIQISTIVGKALHNS